MVKNEKTLTDASDAKKYEKKKLFVHPNFFVFCFLNSFFQTINFDSPRGGISLVTEKGVLTTSRLLVQKAIPSDSGEITLFTSS